MARAFANFAMFMTGVTIAAVVYAAFLLPNRQEAGFALLVVLAIGLIGAIPYVIFAGPVQKRPRYHVSILLGICFIATDVGLNFLLGGPGIMVGFLISVGCGAIAGIVYWVVTRPSAASAS